MPVCRYQGVINVPLYSYPAGAGFPTNQKSDLYGSIGYLGWPSGPQIWTIANRLSANPLIEYAVFPDAYFTYTISSGVFSATNLQGSPAIIFRNHLIVMETPVGVPTIPVGSTGQNQINILHRVLPYRQNVTVQGLTPSKYTYTKILNELDPVTSQGRVFVLATGNGNWVFCFFAGIASFNRNLGLLMFDPFGRGLFGSTVNFPFYNNDSVSWRFSCDLLSGKNYILYFGSQNGGLQISTFNWKWGNLAPDVDNDFVSIDQSGSTGLNTAASLKPNTFGWHTVGNSNSFSPSGQYVIDFGFNNYWGINFIPQNVSGNFNINLSNGIMIDESGTFWLQQTNGPLVTSYQYFPSNIPPSIFDPSILMPFKLPWRKPEPFPIR